MFVNKVINYFKEVKLELTKVDWPSRDQVTRLTMVVFSFSAIVSLYVGGLDFTFVKLLEKLFK